MEKAELIFKGKSKDTQPSFHFSDDVNREGSRKPCKNCKDGDPFHITGNDSDILAPTIQNILRLSNSPNT